MSVPEIQKLDTQRLKLQKELETLRAERNELSASMK